ncbi:hypothetical protein [Mycobacterium sp. 852002-51961_SCH5331710]|uniref:hypothetical protein n=1 Tax=Mycobacterium sp. 852002-51961_SCH5331710 TaxID=1834105 RepID=UPI000A4DE3B4|nr:hypothetical protein [Mycobacterium sp. 852002-51961_SCH5331710]
MQENNCGRTAVASFPEEQTMPVNGGVAVMNTDHQQSAFPAGCLKKWVKPPIMRATGVPGNHFLDGDGH